MTWYASEILAHCNPALLDAVLSNPALAAHAYLINEPVQYSMNEVEDFFSPPPGGLLVIRPVCDPYSHCAEWHRSSVLSWHSLPGAADEEAIAPEALGEHFDPDQRDSFPPAAFLGYLKALSAATQAPLAFFSSSMWGGDTEFEYLWLFGETETASLVLEPGRLSKVAQVDAAGSIQLRELDLLSHVLAYLGAPIPTPFCVLHARSFPWERYKLLDA